MKTITVTITNRPQYLRELLNHLKANNLQGYHLYFGIEPVASQEVRDICESVDFVPKTCLYHPKQLGDQINPHYMVKHAIDKGSEFNVHFDEDLIVSPDAFNLLNWYYENFKDNPLAYSHYSLFNYYSDDTKLSDVVTINDFWGLGWAVFPANWNEIFNKYWFDPAFGGGWDWRFPGVMKHLNKRALMPACARLNHIGLVGVNNNQQWQDYAFTYLKWNKSSIVNEFHLAGDVESRRMNGGPLI